MLRTLELVNTSVEDCLITGYEHLIESVVLPDPGDRHVVAAAIAGGVDAIVTTNQADFPADRLSQFGLEVLHPDDFLVSVIGTERELAYDAIKAMRLRYKKPSMSACDYIASIKAKGLVKSGALLETVSDQI